MKMLNSLILKMILSLSVIFMMTISLNVNAAEIVAQGKCGENVHWVITSDEVLTISGEGEMTEAPWKEYSWKYRDVVVKGSVTKICDDAFKDLQWVKVIVLEEGVTTIGDNAFDQLDAIVYVPSSVVEIDGYPFSGDKNRLVICAEEGTVAYEHGKKITSTDSIAPGEVKSGRLREKINWTWDVSGTLTLEGNGPMPEDMNFEEFKYPIFHVVIKPGITSVSRHAFQYCYWLENVQLPEGMKTLEGAAFGNCSSLKEINIPVGVTNLDGSVFFSCVDLEKIELPKGLENLGGGTFEGCRKLKSIVIPKSVEAVRFETFVDCDCLEEVVISEGVALIDSKAFTDCNALKKVTIIDKNTEIEKDAFYESSTDFTIYCQEDSLAKTFAEENGYRYEIVEFDLETESVTEYFSDVQTFDWFAEYVQYVYDKGLMRGMEGTYYFRPTEALTKAQVAQILYNREGRPEVTDRRACTELRDIDSWEWYVDAVCWAYNEGIITGDLNTKEFKPYAMIQRQQIALMLYRYTVKKGYQSNQTSDFAGLKNVDRISNWAEDGMSWAVGAGIITGVERNYFGNIEYDLSPDWDATRAEMAAMMTRYSKLYDEN